MINIQNFTKMMDEQLIDEVAQHGVIFNRQKYYLNGSTAGGKYETKDEAWQVIAMKLHSDVETCKKRWKYLRERYVSQRKQGDPPVYEHLSRPYLEKMKFLDQHIQPRKSYRNVTNFLTSPHSANSSYSEYNMDSKSNNSMKNMAHFGNVSQHSYQQQDPQHAMNALSNAAAAALESANGQVKIEADQVFRDFAAAVASQQLQHISQSQMQHQQAAAVAAAMADSSQTFSQQFREGADTSVSLSQNGAINSGGITSSSSSLKSPLSSPLATVNGNATTTHASSTPQQVAAHSSSATHSSSVAPSTSSNSGGNNNHNQSNPQQMPAHVYNDSNNDDLDSSTSSNYHMKKPRVTLSSVMTNGTNTQQQSSTNGVLSNSVNNNHNHFVDDTDDDSDENSSSMLQLQSQSQLQQDNHFNNSMGLQRPSLNVNSIGSSNNNHIGNQQQGQGMFTSNADFLFQLYQQLPQQATTSQQSNFNKFQTPQNPLPLPQRSSEHLLGELVTTELLKMSKERRKNVQKRILEILFFDD